MLPVRSMLMMCDVIALFAACDFRLMASTLLLDAIGQRRFMIRRRVSKLGQSPFRPGRRDPLMVYSVLADESAGKAGDLYIRSVCFSPDGKYLATGAEDKQIRVQRPYFSLLPLTLPSDLGYRQEAHSQYL